MSAILDTINKFQKLGNISFDVTLKTETKFESKLEFTKESFFLSRGMIGVVFFQVPRSLGHTFYLKIINRILRAILSMVCSTQHELARCLVEILDSVLKFFLSICIIYK